jgi:hypothetical protein
MLHTVRISRHAGGSLSPQRAEHAALLRRSDASDGPLPPHPSLSSTCATASGNADALCAVSLPSLPFSAALSAYLRAGLSLTGPRVAAGADGDGAAWPGTTPAQRSGSLQPLIADVAGVPDRAALQQDGSGVPSAVSMGGMARLQVQPPAPAIQACAAAPSIRCCARSC